nr:MAG TPA: hypothetical protein [Caudoviricetes sp.]
MSHWRFSANLFREYCRHHIHFSSGSPSFPIALLVSADTEKLCRFQLGLSSYNFTKNINYRNNKNIIKYKNTLPFFIIL